MDTNSWWTRRGVGRRRAAWLLMLAVTLIGVAALTTRGAPRQERRQQPTASPLMANGDTTCRAVIDSARLPAPSPDAVARARSCVFRIDSVRDAAPLKSIRGEFERLAMLHLQIPEFHDEQRLWDGYGALGPLAFIYASPQLGAFRYEWQIAEHGPVGVLAAVVFVDPLPNEPMPITYGQLHLKPRVVNCVWLAYDPAAAPNRRWTARVTHVPTTQPCRPQATAASYPLVVRRSAGLPFADYPPVARFSAASNRQPLLGFKCLAGWCELGPAGFVSVSPMTGMTDALGRVKGWHDEQDLAEFDGTRWVPAVHAAIVPVPNVDQLEPAAFRNTKVHVATIVLRQDPPVRSKYHRWGLRAGQNRLVLSDVGGTWTAFLYPATGGQPTTWAIVDRMKHLDAAVPGTARFRWTQADDGAWVPCGQACCDAQGPF